MTFPTHNPGGDGPHDRSIGSGNCPRRRPYDRRYRIPAGPVLSRRADWDGERGKGCVRRTPCWQQRGKLEKETQLIDTYIARGVGRS